MMPIRDLFTKLFKKKEDDKPWLEYYSREERSIKFTDKSIYDFMIDCVGGDKDFILEIDLVIMNSFQILIYVQEV